MLKTISQNTEQQIGHHILIDIYSANFLTDKNQIELIFYHAAKHAEVKVLHSFFHSFGSQLGVTGFLALAESHISIHTWPEHNYAAIDIFMCGNHANIKACCDIIIKSFGGDADIKENKRGMIT